MGKYFSRKNWIFVTICSKRFAIENFNRWNIKEVFIEYSFEAEIYDAVMIDIKKRE